MKINKLFIGTMLTVACAMAFTACDPTDKDDPFGPTPNPNPTSDTLTVAEASVPAKQNASFGYVSGYIVGCYNFDATDKFVIGVDQVDGNVLIADSPDHTDTYNGIMAVQLPAGVIRAALNLKDVPGNLKKRVIVYGTLEKYCGIAGVRNVSYAIVDGVPVGADPSIVSENVTVSEALAIINNLAIGGSTDRNYIVTGTVSEIITTSAQIAQYNNCDFKITDGTNTIKAFRTKGYNKVNFTDGLISVGDEVKVEGPLMRYANASGVEDPEIAYGWLVN